MKGYELIGTTAAELMDKIDYTESNAEIAEVLIAIRIEEPGDNEDDPGWSAVQWRASDSVWTHQVGLLEAVLEGMRAARIRMFTSEDDDDSEES